MNLLSIGGSDPSSGAGVQGDIKTFSSLGAYGLTVVTAVTSQNTARFGGAEPVSPEMLESQLDLVMSDFAVDGIKIGMVYGSAAIRTLHRRLDGARADIPVVVDPVVRSTTGGALLEESAMPDFRRYIVPLATVVTPNWSEARALSGPGGGPGDTPDAAARAIRGMGAQNVVITGLPHGPRGGGGICDLVLAGDGRAWSVPGRAVPGTTHGGGCAYSAAVLAGLAGGRTLEESLGAAKRLAHDAMLRAHGPGRGILVVDSQTSDPAALALAGAINRFVRLRGVGEIIPECQTNFVYSWRRPSSTGDVLGIEGRIVRTGTTASVAGRLAYGGSKHVASALLAVNRRHPHVLSAANLRYRDSTVQRIRGAGLAVLSYDRAREPPGVKSGGSSVEWGVGEAVRGAAGAPDAVYHTGDVGKEPMIIVFGRDPDDVLRKVEAAVRGGGRASR